MIPKKVHYCWFSGEEFPEEIRKCIESWKKFLPNYEFVLWDKARAEAVNIPWVTLALDQRKWAFAADAIRLYALKTEGGIYLDLDVEVLKSFDPLLKRQNFFGYENGSKRIEGAVLGAEKNDPAISAALEFYTTRNFEYREEDVDNLVLPNILAKAFSKFSLQGATDHSNAPIDIFPEDYFSPKSFMDGKIRITQNTYCIHHFQSNWRPESIRKGIERRQSLYRNFPTPIAKLFSIPLSLWTNVVSLGFAGTYKKIIDKLK